jgi:hypothetical protein
MMEVLYVAGPYIPRRCWIMAKEIYITDCDIGGLVVLSGSNSSTTSEVDGNTIRGYIPDDMTPWGSNYCIEIIEDNLPWLDLEFLWVIKNNVIGAEDFAHDYGIIWNSVGEQTLSLESNTFINCAQELGENVE